LSALRSIVLKEVKNKMEIEQNQINKKQEEGFDQRIKLIIVCIM
jgi:hypothetical protein